MERKIKIFKNEIGSGEKDYLNGKASYRRVFDRFIRDAVLCNNIVEVDPEIFYNQEAGFYSYDELYNEKLEELKEDYQGKIIDALGLTSEQINDGYKTLAEIEEEARDYADEEQYNFEFYQYFIVDLNYYDVQYLKEMEQHTLQIMYSDKLDCYVVGVGHFGTGWDYVGSDFELEIIEEKRN